MADPKISVTESHTRSTTLTAIVGERTIELQITKVDGQLKSAMLSSKREEGTITVIIPMNAIHFNSFEEVDVALQLLSKAIKEKDR